MPWPVWLMFMPGAGRQAAMLVDWKWQTWQHARSRLAPAPVRSPATRARDFLLGMANIIFL